jgi:ketosteroid isomerase-like protein
VVVHVRRLGTLTSGPAALPPKEEEMNSDQARANLELVFDWIDALRRGEIDSIADRFDADVDWVDVAGDVGCEGREQVLEWLRQAQPESAEVDALELRANDSNVVLAVRDRARPEIAGIQLDGQLFTVFKIRDGQIVHLHDHAHRADALAAAGVDGWAWR